MSTKEEAAAAGKPRNEIFVRGLSFTTRELALARHIETVAPVLDVHILMTYNNRSKGSAFVRLMDPSRIDEVVEKLNAKPLDGRYLEIARAKPYSELPPPPRRHFYPPYPSHRYGGGSYRRPPFQHRRPAAAAEPEHEEAEARPRPGRGRFERKKREPNPDRTKSELTVAVLNLPYVAKEEDMRDIFDGFTIVNPKICRAANGKSKGIGFATFLTHEDQQRAMEQAEDSTVEGRKIHIVEAFLLAEELEEEKKNVEAAKKAETPAEGVEN